MSDKSKRIERIQRIESAFKPKSVPLCRCCGKYQIEHRIPRSEFAKEESSKGI
jgi:ribosomal protein L32